MIFFNPSRALAGEKSVTAVEQLAGRWYGCWYRQDLRVDVSIGSDGIAQFTFQTNPTLYADLEIRDGIIYHGYRRG